MKTKTSLERAFTLVEIMIVVAIIGLLAAIAIPNFLRARATAQMDTCISNLRQIDGAVQRWAMENGKTGADAPSSPDIIKPYIGRGTGELPWCPLAGTDHDFSYSYTIHDVSTAPTCNLGGTNGTEYNSDYPHVLLN